MERVVSRRKRILTPWFKEQGICFPEKGYCSLSNFPLQEFLKFVSEFYFNIGIFTHASRFDALPSGVKTENFLVIFSDGNLQSYAKNGVILNDEASYLGWINTKFLAGMQTIKTADEVHQIIKEFVPNLGVWCHGLQQRPDAWENVAV